MERNVDRNIRMTGWIVAAQACALAFAANAVGSAVVVAKELAKEKSSSPVVDADANVHLPSLIVPFSSLASPEAKQAFLERVSTSAALAKYMGEDIAKRRKAVDDILVAPLIAKQNARYAVSVEQRQIGGVYTEVFTPAEGVAPQNRTRVLINLHGGGFIIGARSIGKTESIPIAAVGKIQVISVDYRQGPENKFPAASEDVAAVYRELLKTHRPGEIGIYGCSAGGLLTAQIVAWLDRQKIPLPGAIGILCASADGVAWGGDAIFFGTALVGEMPPSPAAIISANRQEHPYFGRIDLHDSLVSPARYPEVLSKFPPTLLITGTRDFALSTAADTHNRLSKVGVESQLYIWDGVGHAFLVNPDLPESREAYDVIVKFFDRNLK
jgi:acetyl esterase/lipase